MTIMKKGANELKKICLVSQKGGVAKTTTAINVSSILVEMGYRVLDPQGNLSQCFRVEDETFDNTIHEVFTKDLEIEKAIHKTEFGVDVVPANINFANAELEISNKISRENILKNAFNKCDLDYDFVILDLPPNLGLLTINGMVASDYFLVPVDVGMFSLNGIKQLLDVSHLIKKSGLNNANILGVLLTKVDDRTKLARESRNTLEDIFGDKVFKTYIHNTISVVNSQHEQKPINFYDKKSSAYKEYKEMIREVLKRVNK